MKTYNWILKFSNGNEMGGGYKTNGFDDAREYVERIIKEIERAMGYKCVAFTVSCGKMKVDGVPSDN